jgi:hypothetical protein
MCQLGMWSESEERSLLALRSFGMTTETEAKRVKTRTLCGRRKECGTRKRKFNGEERSLLASRSFGMTTETETKTTAAGVGAGGARLVVT